MSSTPTIEEKVQKLLQQSAEVAKSWTAPPTMPQLRAEAPKLGGAFAVVTCLDPRCVPERSFGPEFFGPVIRNAGGRVNRDVVASLVILRTLGDLSGVVVVHHTDCGIVNTTDDIIRSEAKERTPDAVSDIDALTWGCIPEEEFEAAIVDDVRKLKAEKVLGGVEVRGMALDTFTNEVREIEV